MMTKELSDVIAVSQTFNTLPSEVLGVTDPLARYCFNEACTAYINYIDDGKKPRYPSDMKSNPLLRKMEPGLL